MVEIAGVKAPRSNLARDITGFVQDAESQLPFHHSTRVFCWGGLTAARPRSPHSKFARNDWLPFILRHGRFIQCIGYRSCCSPWSRCS